MDEKRIVTNQLTLVKVPPRQQNAYSLLGEHHFLFGFFRDAPLLLKTPTSTCLEKNRYQVRKIHFFIGDVAGVPGISARRTANVG